MLYYQPTITDKVIQEFAHYLVLNDIHSKNYLWQIKKFLRTVKFENLSQQSIDQYLVDVRQKTSAGTMNNTIKAMKHFFRFLKLDYQLPKQHIVTADKRKVKSIDEKKLAEILSACDWFDFQNPVQVKAILLLMYYTGLRKSEVSILKRKDINLVDKTVNVYLQKVDTWKEFLLPNKVIAAIKDYYISDPEERINAFNIGKGGITYIFNKLKPGFPEIRLHPHLFKKSAVTWLAQFYSVEVISLLVGISPETIRNHYLAIDYEEVKKNFWKTIKEE